MKTHRLKTCLSFCFFAASLFVGAQDTSTLPPEATEFYEPKPGKVNPGPSTTSPPEDAIILFDGSGLQAWESAGDGTEAQWEVANNTMTIKPGAGDIRTTQEFGDMQLHLEWKAPEEIEGEGQGRGNSGVIIMGKYEVQVLDSYDNETYTNGQAASVYKQSPPLVNATNPPGEWNVYDIIFKAPRFNEEGMLISPATVSVLHNGILVQDHFRLRGPTEYRGIPNYTPHPEKLPLVLQDHGDLVSFRNIWVRELN